MEKNDTDPRMKNVNRGGPALLGRMPEPRQLTIDEVIGELDDPTLIVLDTRANRAGFMKAHLRGSLYAPAKDSFSDFAASYLGPDERIVLIVNSTDQVEEQVRGLIRIGFDKIEGWLCVADVASTKGTLASIRSVKFRKVPALIAEDLDTLVLDVCGAAEYEARHIRGALSVAHTRLRARVAEVPANRIVIVPCKSGNRAAAAAAYLERTGRRTIYVNDAFGKVPAELTAGCYAKLSIAGAASGLLSGLFGVGGGFVIVPSLLYVGITRVLTHPASGAGRSPP